MTKTWDPNRAATLPHWKRGLRSKKKRQRRPAALVRRDGFMCQARHIARANHLGLQLKLSAVKGYVDRAVAAAPISRRQVAGLIELLGRPNAEKVVGPIWL